MEEVTLENGKMPGGDGGPLGDETIRLLLEQMEKLMRELDHIWKDIES